MTVTQRLLVNAREEPLARFYVPPRLLAIALATRECFLAQPPLLNLSRTQFLFELDVLEAALAHPLRVATREQASVVLLPILAVVSWQADKCPWRGEGSGRYHVQRQRLMAQALREEVDLASGPPHIVPCTCVMQRSRYGTPLFTRLYNHSRAIVAMTHGRRAPPESVARLHVIAPYHSPPPFREAAGTRDATTCTPLPQAIGGGALSAVHSAASNRPPPPSTQPSAEASPPPPVVLAFAGSPETTRLWVTCVRHHFFALARDDARLAGLPSARMGGPNGAGCAASGNCVDGFHFSKRFEAPGSSRAAGGPKVAMAQLMARAQFCLVPEGDSPESSRLYDAVAARCTPLVITSSDEGLLVPRSRHWRKAAIVLRDRDFLSMDAPALIAYLQAQSADEAAVRRRCAALGALAVDMGAARVLSHTVRVAANLSSMAFDPTGVVADADALLPPPARSLPEAVARALRRARRRRRPLPQPGDVVSAALSPGLNWSKRVRATVASVDASTARLELVAADLRGEAAAPAALPTVAERKRRLLYRPSGLPAIDTDPACADDYEPIAGEAAWSALSDAAVPPAARDKPKERGRGLAGGRGGTGRGGAVGSGTRARGLAGRQRRRRA